MPYIQDNDREQFKDIIHDCVVKLRNASAGERNYVISSIIWGLFENNKNYNEANELMGVLECVKMEFYRRRIAAYEDIKIKQNGDVL